MGSGLLTQIKPPWRLFVISWIILASLGLFTISELPGFSTTTVIHMTLTMPSWHNLSSVISSLRISLKCLAVPIADIGSGYQSKQMG